MKNTYYFFITDLVKIFIKSSLISYVIRALDDECVRKFVEQRSAGLVKGRTARAAITVATIRAAHHRCFYRRPVTFY